MPVSTTELSGRNRLATEKSPYLQQHAGNPVHWFPWGEEAFRHAKAEDKPVFLSIGYSSCHWCHVMAEDSFSRTDVADLLNRDFISIKVDREERPDIDHFYQEAVSAMSGGGGWPLTVFLTPERAAFFGATFIPREDQDGVHGLKTTLATIARYWRKNRKRLTGAAAEVLDILQTVPTVAPAERSLLSRESLSRTFTYFTQSFDDTYGGFGMAPKFPVMHNLSFLLRYWKHTGDTAALAMAEKTLLHVVRGGIHDHCGGGFHRYATDRHWLVPHFEKMLYDQALIVSALMETFQVTRNREIAAAARSTLDFVTREMTAESGGFYSSFDADAPSEDDPAEHQEGIYYLWGRSEVIDMLPDDAGDIFCFHYGIKNSGNLPREEFGSLNILFERHSVEQTARHFSRDTGETADMLARGLRLLLKQRGKRPRPALDDTVLADWNGLMISALVQGSLVFRDDAYLEAARKAARFVLTHMTDGRHTLLHSYRHAKAGHDSFISDYAFFANALLDLYEATSSLEYLTESLGLATRMLHLFWDGEQGGFFITAAHRHDLPLRQKDTRDSSLPSGNSIALQVLLRLGRITGSEEWGKRAEETIAAYERHPRHPAASTQFISSAYYRVFAPLDITIAEGKEGSPQSYIQAVSSYFLPEKAVVFRPRHDEALKAALPHIPYLDTFVPAGGNTTAYVCENKTCHEPVTSVHDLDALIRKAVREHA